MRTPVFFFPLVILAVAGLFVLLLFLFALIQVGVITVAFSKLGLTPGQAFLVLLATLIGSGMNIPVRRTKKLIRLDDFQGLRLGGLLGRYRFPKDLGFPTGLIQEQIVAVNVGGCIIPVLLSMYFLAISASQAGVLAAAAATTFACYRLARPVPGLGIGIPVLVPPLVAVLAAVLLVPDPDQARAAYVAGSLGTLIGADLLHLARPETVKQLNGPLLSIGGAGTFDGIFLSGIIAVLLA